MKIFFFVSLALYICSVYLCWLAFYRETKAISFKNDRLFWRGIKGQAIFGPLMFFAAIYLEMTKQ